LDDGGAGRRETIRYHESFYAESELFAPGTWLHRPAQFVLRSLDHVHPERPIIAVDLGCGVGRHTIPIAQALPAGSHVVGVDLLPIAAESLRRNCTTFGVESVVHPVVADLDRFGLATDSVDLLVACSSLEHVTDFAALERLIADVQRATRVGGLHCVMLGTDRRELDRRGRPRPALVEFHLDSRTGRSILDRMYVGWLWIDNSAEVLRVDEERDGERYKLETTYLKLLARRL
jgi:tellurite methyltransferase